MRHFVEPPRTLVPLGQVQLREFWQQMFFPLLGLVRLQFSRSLYPIVDLPRAADRQLHP